MNKILMTAVCAPLILMGASGCDVEAERAAYTLSIVSPAEGGTVATQFNVEIAIDGDFTLRESECDASDVEFDYNMWMLAPNWNPYDCSDENGDPIEGQGNVQIFVDGIFNTIGTSTDIPVDLTPAFSFAEYGPIAIDTDDDGVEDTYIDVDGDGAEDYFFYCSYYFPDDSLGYASTYFEGGMNYSMMDYYGMPLYDYSTLQENPNYDPDPESETYDPAPYIADTRSDSIVDNYYDMLAYGLTPWMGFSYNGVVMDAFDDVDPQVHHFITAELHYDNHSTVYGANRAKVFVDGAIDIDLSSPEFTDWCGMGPMGF